MLRLCSFSIGMKMGISTSKFRPLSAVISSRLIKSSSGRLVHDTSLSNLRDYDDEKIAD